MDTKAFPHYDSRQQERSHHLSARSASLLSPGRARASNRFTRGLSVPSGLYRLRGLRKRWHLIPSTIGRGHRRPHAPGNRYLSAGIHLVAIWCRYSTMGTRIIAMITLTLDKEALVKAGFSTQDSVPHVPGRSTPHQTSRPRGFASLGATAHCNVMGWGSTYQ
jgi:hypothetical protein